MTIGNLFNILITTLVVSGFLWFFFNLPICKRWKNAGHVVFWYFTTLFLGIIVTSILIIILL